MALLFDLLFWEGCCLALTEKFSIDASAVVCMVSLMTLVILFANGVDTNTGSLADGSVVAVSSRLPSNTEVSTQGLFDLGGSFEGTYDLLLIHYHWNTAFPTVAVPLLKQRKVLSLKINFKLTQLPSLKREYIYVNI